jgi:hypothetical protein
MAILKKDLQALRRDFKALEKKMEKLLQAAEKSGKTKIGVKTKAVKAKAVKKVKVAAGKKTPQITATDQILKIIKRSKKGVDVPTLKKKTGFDQILKIIKRSKKGVDVPTLKKKTGFDDKKVRNIVFRASKEGRIKKSGRGVYVGA